MMEHRAFANVLDTVGITPLVRLRRVIPANGARVWAKMESQNPGGSVKDRICLAMIEAAEEQGRLRPGGTIIEPTSGNTGIGLALVAAAKGYRCVLTMPESMSLERRQILQAYGAEVVLTPAEEGIEGAISKAEELLAAHDDAFMPQQFMNPANPEVHRRTTVRELIAAMGDDPVHAFVAGVGTGGTITGAAAALRERYPGVRVVAVEPATSAVLSGGRAGPHKLQGLGAGFIPEVLDPSVIDEITGVRDRDAYEMRVRLAREEGMLVGISAGAAVIAAAQQARVLGPNCTVVVVVPSYGDRYFSLDEYFTS